MVKNLWATLYADSTEKGSFSYVAYRHHHHHHHLSLSIWELSLSLSLSLCNGAVLQYYSVCTIIMERSTHQGTYVDLDMYVVHLNRYLSYAKKLQIFHSMLQLVKHLCCEQNEQFFTETEFLKSLQWWRVYSIFINLLLKKNKTRAMKYLSLIQFIYNKLYHHWKLYDIVCCKWI